MSRTLFSGWVLAVVLLVAGAGISRAQEAPEPPDPPDPPDPPQVFVLNDGAVHLGVTLGDVTTEKAQELKLPAVGGAIVNHVQKESPAAKAGIQVGDAIMEFDGVHVRSSAELRRLIRETPAGRKVEMKIMRNGKNLVLSAKLDVSSDHNTYSYNGPGVHIPPINIPEINMPPMDFPDWGGHRATLGISGENLTPQLAQYFGAKQGTGVLISEVTKGGAADKAGLKAGDIIEKVNGKPINGVDELRDALNDNFTADTRKVNLTIVREHHEQTVDTDLTRSQMWGKRTANDADSKDGEARVQMEAQANKFRAQADQQRAMVRAEVSKQTQHVQAEWQRQLQEQMKALKDQFKQMQDLHVVLRQDGEI